MIPFSQLTAGFYVYELHDHAGAVFYVGKGSGRRVFQHVHKARAGDPTRKAMMIRANIAAGGQVVPVIVFQTDNEAEAFREEIRLIALYGREALANMTDGGDGPSNPTAETRAKLAAGRKGCQASQETREKQRCAKLGIPRSAETRAKISAYQRGSKHPWARLPRSEETRRKLATFKGKKHTPETIEKMRQAKRGHEVTEETRRKISASKMGTAPWNKGRRSKSEEGRNELF